MNVRQRLNWIVLGVLAYAALVGCMALFWATTTAVFGGPLP